MKLKPLKPAKPPRSLEKCGLHPLIHTFLKFNLEQNIESIKKAEQVKECDEEKDRTNS